VQITASLSISVSAHSLQKESLPMEKSTPSGTCISSQDYHPNRAVNKTLSSLSKLFPAVLVKPSQGGLHAKSSSGISHDELCANLEIGQEITSGMVPFELHEYEDVIYDEKVYNHFQRT
jgi:hypothetical protein